MSETQEMNTMQTRGSHVFLDYTGYQPQVNDDGEWMLNLLEKAVETREIRNVHAHVEQFDGSVSPPGYAAVVLLDEPFHGFYLHCRSAAPELLLLVNI